MPFNIAALTEARTTLDNHPLLTGKVIVDIADVRIFMQHHVYAVWDFMCLVKTLQHAVVPSTTIWIPQPHTAVGRYINEVVLGEETDIGPDGNPVSHYDLYLRAMREVGADTEGVEAFIGGLRTVGWHVLNELLEQIPSPAERFCRKTLDFIGTQKPHVVAAAFAYGRETVIPRMFTGVVHQLIANNISAPTFKYYLQRHIDLDGDEHGPISVQMVETLCQGDESRLREAEAAALDAIAARISFWTDVQIGIEDARL